MQQPPYEQICNAIDDGELQARWLDETYPPRSHSGMLWWPDKPVYVINALRSQTVRLENGGEIDWGEGRWRKLLLSRQDMHRIFVSAGTDSNSTTELRRLSKNSPGLEIMHEAISAIYDLAKQQGVKPPNVREIPELVQKWLAKHKGVTAPRSWIKGLAAEARYNTRRGKSGARVEGSLRPVSKLQI
jgi:hypothetical protein